MLCNLAAVGRQNGNSVVVSCRVPMNARIVLILTGKYQIGCSCFSTMAATCYMKCFCLNPWVQHHKRLQPANVAAVLHGLLGNEYILSSLVSCCILLLWIILGSNKYIQVLSDYFANLLTLRLMSWKWAAALTLDLENWRKESWQLHEYLILLMKF